MSRSNVAGFLRFERGGVTAALPAWASNSRTRSIVSNALSAISPSAAIPAEDDRPNQPVRLGAGQMKPDRVAQRVGQGMGLGAQSAAGSSDRMTLVGYLFAPALW